MLDYARNIRQGCHFSTNTDPPITVDPVVLVFYIVFGINGCLVPEGTRISVENSSVFAQNITAGDH